MKGLFRKDLYVLRGIGVIFILMDLVFSLIPDLRFFAFAAFYTVLLTLILMQADEQCKFDTLLPMLPVSRKQVVLETYIIGWGYIALLSTLAVSGQALLWSRMGRMAVDRAYLLLLCFDVCLALMMQGLVLPVLFRYGTTKGRLILMVVMGAVTFLSVSLMTGTVLTGLLGVLMKVRSWHLLLLGAALSLASVPLSVAGYTRRLKK